MNGNNTNYRSHPSLVIVKVISHKTSENETPGIGTQSNSLLFDKNSRTLGLKNNILRFSKLYSLIQISVDVHHISSVLCKFT